MDLFKQALAPMPKTAWDEINARAEHVINAYLTTRKTLKVEGPYGLDKTHVPTGRMTLIDSPKGSDVKGGLYDAVSLLETRATFELDRWELDNISRGAKDIDLTSLEEAVKRLVLYEENTLYNGNAQAKIKGLKDAAKNTLSLENNPQKILEKVAEAALLLKKAYATKPYHLIVGKTVYGYLNQLHGNRLLREIIEQMIEGQVVLSEVLEGALLLPAKHPDIEFTIGQDYTIGYESHDLKTIRFFIMNSYTMRVLDPNIIVKFDV